MYIKLKCASLVNDKGGVSKFDFLEDVEPDVVCLPPRIIVLMFSFSQFVPMYFDEMQFKAESVTSINC